MTVILLAAAIGFALGYTARCVRPLHRINNWAWDQDYQRRRDLRDNPTRRRQPGWWAAQAVFAVETLAALVLYPRRTVHAWRHRNDPPPSRSPAVRVGRREDQP